MATKKTTANPYKFRIDFDNSDIVICTSLSKLLNKEDTKAQRLLAKQRSLYPDFDVIVASQKKPNGNKTDFDMMIDYLNSWERHDLAEELLEMKNSKVKSSVGKGGRMKREHTFLHIRSRFYELCEENGLQNAPGASKKS